MFIAIPKDDIRDYSDILPSTSTICICYIKPTKEELLEYLRYKTMLDPDKYIIKEIEDIE